MEYLEDMAQAINKLDPSMLRTEEIEQLQLLLQEHGRLPEPIYQLLMRIVSSMRKGQGVLLVPESGALTTQAAANYLGVSRPFLVGLLEEGEIPFYTVGTHRRVNMADVQAYAKKRDGDRRKRLDDLFDRIDQEGKYE